MSKTMNVRSLLLAIVLTAFGLGSSLAGELKGRVVMPKGSGPAVVFLKGASGGNVPKEDTVITHTSDGSFEPAVVIGFVGNDFVFKTEDNKLHTTHLYLHLASQRNRSGRPMKNGATLYNIALPTKGMEVRRPIKSYFEFTDETGRIDVRCNPHPEEKATALVFNHPYAAVSEQDGSFTIANVPAGTQEVWVWHGGQPARWQSVDVRGDGATTITVELGAR